MKKTIAVLLALLMLCALFAGCKKNNEGAQTYSKSAEPIGGEETDAPTGGPNGPGEPTEPGTPADQTDPAKPTDAPTVPDYSDLIPELISKDAFEALPVVYLEFSMDGEDEETGERTAMEGAVAKKQTENGVVYMIRTLMEDMEVSVIYEEAAGEEKAYFGMAGMFFDASIMMDANEIGEMREMITSVLGIAYGSTPSDDEPDDDSAVYEKTGTVSRPTGEAAVYVAEGEDRTATMYVDLVTGFIVGFESDRDVFSVSKIDLSDAHIPEGYAEAFDLSGLGGEATPEE